MSFIRVRTINGKQYTYEERRWRGADGKVKSKSIYLGGGSTSPSSGGGGNGSPPTGGLQILPRPVKPEDRGLRYIEKWMERDELAKVETWQKTARKTPAEKLMAEGNRLTEERDKLNAAKDKLSKELGVDLSPNTGPVEKTASETASAPSEASEASNAEGSTKE